MLGWGPVLSTKLGLDPVSSCLPKLRSYTITYKLSCCLRSSKIFLPPTLYKGFLNRCVFYETYCKQQFEAIRIWLLNRSLQLFSPYQDNLFSIGKKQRSCLVKFFKFCKQMHLKRFSQRPHIGLTRRVNKHNFGRGRELG